jgi:hypothetical protein
MHIASIGIDLGKTTFHLVALEERNKIPQAPPCGLCFLGKWLMSYDLKRNLGLRPTNRPLYGLKAFSTTITTDINDLPATSPHGK